MSLFLVNLYNQDAELRKQEIENRSLTENVTEYINQHYADSLTIDQLAEQFFVSKYHLMHEFSQKTGTSVYRYLMQQRLQCVNCWNREPCQTRLICCAASKIMQISTERSAAHTGRAPGNTPGPTG